jgi:hypothetical protein
MSAERCWLFMPVPRLGRLLCAQARADSGFALVSEPTSENLKMTRLELQLRLGTFQRGEVELVLPLL